jgi:hypothetical protein
MSRMPAARNENNNCERRNIMHARGLFVGAPVRESRAEPECASRIQIDRYRRRRLGPRLGRGRARAGGGGGGGECGTGAGGVWGSGTCAQVAKDGP